MCSAFPTRSAAIVAFVGSFVLARGALAQTDAPPPKHWGGPDPDSAILHLPVVGVTFLEAAAYARWKGLRLPAAHEWEKAARGIEGFRYPWGDDFDPGRHRAGR